MPGWISDPDQKRKKTGMQKQGGHLKEMSVLFYDVTDKMIRIGFQKAIITFY